MAVQSFEQGDQVRLCKNMFVMILRFGEIIMDDVKGALDKVEWFKDMCFGRR